MPDISENDEDVGARAFWSGILSFGLVSIPVDLYPASKDGGAPLRTLGPDGTPLARRYYCPHEEHEEEVPPEHLVRGYELTEGKYVVVTDEELDALDPKKSREIDLRLFVDEEELDPLYFDRGYLLAPSRDAGKAYRLLAAVMERTKRAGIATFVMRENEYLVAILSRSGLLRGEILRFESDVRSVKDLDLPKAGAPPRATVKKLEAAIDKLETDHLPTAELSDDRTLALTRLVEQKLRKKKDVVHSRVPETAPGTAGGDVIDLMEALRRSLGGRSPAKAERKATRHHSPARRTPRIQERPKRAAAKR